ERFAGFGLGRHFVRQRRKHAGTAGHARTRTRAGRNRTGTLPKRTIGTSGPARASGARGKGTALPAGSALGGTHGLAGARAARAVTRGQRAAIAGGQRPTVSRRQRTAIAGGHRALRLSCRARLPCSGGPTSSGLCGRLLSWNTGARSRWALSWRTLA